MGRVATAPRGDAVSASVRACDRPGLRLRDKPPTITVASLLPDGSWRVCRGSRFFYEPVELVGTDVESIAALAQRLRDQAPDETGLSTYIRGVNAAIYSDVASKMLVIQVIMIVCPRSTGRSLLSIENDTTGEDETEEAAFVGPLPSVHFAIVRRIRSYLNPDNWS